MAKRQIEEFERDETLGVGTVGTIYRARDLTHDRLVALKILLPTVSSDELIKARFYREMFILEKLDHPNIVKYYGGGRDENLLFYAMELVEGGSLKDILRQSGYLSWQEAVTIGIQVCAALQHAHNHGVIHRDLKPANLLFTPDGNLKLADFGIAFDMQAADAITNVGLTVGTCAYMSPEQIIGDRTISGQTDLYALGCLLFEMLTGRQLFEGANFPQLFEQHLRKPPPRVRELRPDVPAALDDLVDQLLQKSPDARPFNARSAQVALLRLLDQEMHEETDGDVAAADALDQGRSLLSRRLRGILDLNEARSVSWSSLGYLALAILGVICAAWWLGSTD